MAPKKWSTKYSPLFEKEWDKLDPYLQGRVIDFFTTRLDTNEDPKRFAKPLTGNLKSFWRFRVGDYRLICEFQDKEKIIYLIRIAHRREIYD